jgi:hypothetical protein
MLAGAGAAVYHAGKRHQASEQQEAEQDQQAAAQSEAPEATPATGEKCDGRFGPVQILVIGATSSGRYEIPGPVIQRSADAE